MHDASAGTMRCEYWTIFQYDKNREKELWETAMETNNYQTNEIEIDLWTLLAALWDKLFIIILSALTGAIIFYLFTTLFITPTYDSTTKIYVLNKQNSDNSSITYSDLQSSAQLTKDYMELVTTRPVLEKVISSLGLEKMTYNDLKEKINVSTATDGRIIYIKVTDENPKQAKDIADEIRSAVSAQIVDVMDVEAVSVVEEANLPDEPARPNKLRNMILGALLGFIIAFMVVVVRAVMDDRVKTEEDVEYYLHMSVLGTIPLDDHMKKKTMKKGKKIKRRNRKRDKRKGTGRKAWQK